MGRHVIRRRCERRGDHLFTGVNNKHSRIFFALAKEGRYAIRSLQFISRPQEPDSHDGWIRGKGIPPFSRKSEIRSTKSETNPKSETRGVRLGFGNWFRISDFVLRIFRPSGLALPIGEALIKLRRVFSGMVRREPCPNRGDPEAPHRPDRTTSGERWNGGERSGPAYPGRGFASRGEGRCPR
jgi:hypothetical protein